MTSDFDHITETATSPYGVADVASFRDDTRTKVYLHPGQLHATDHPTAITTIVGSCVAVCLWDSRRRCGGMVHYLLPGDETSSSARYGKVGIEMLVRDLAALGAASSSMEAKIFGGACMFKAFRHNDIGLNNVEIARSLMRTARVHISIEDVGGDRGRKLIFHTDTGNVFATTL